MQIQPITRENFQDWLAMRKELYSGLSDTFHRREMEAILDSDESHAFIATDTNGDDVGLLELSLRNIVDGCVGGPVGYIEGLYVRPACRNRGYGRLMVEFAEAWSRDRGCREIATDSELENIRAQDFFRRCAFTETWRIVEFTKVLKSRPEECG